MIEVRNLSKVYTSRKGLPCRALDNVSFVLPDTGMVFVVGKSGCGKSTLLNLLGGLDTQTEGDVIVDGQAFSSFTPRDQDNYHNDYLGFVFQNYYLLESLTVAQNVMMPLELQSKASEEAVKEMLRVVDLEELAGRYPRQLSGGQCQRVAIARALIKQPKLVLADEPTGNLDSKSGKQILQALKQYSRDHLVLIVSHNREDADVYADRIIELADGRVTLDVVRNEHSTELSVTDSEIVLQRGCNLSPEQLNQVNARLAEGKPISMRQVDDRFLPTGAVATVAASKPHMADHRLSFRGGTRLFSMFCRKQVANLAVTMVLIICLAVVLGVCQMFLQFNTDDETLRLLESTGSEQFALQKGFKNDDSHYNPIGYQRTINISDEDVQAFVDSGYEGNIYKMYNISLGIVADYYTLEQYKVTAAQTNYADFFAKTGNGVLVCSKDYIKSVYHNEDGEIEVLAGDINSENVVNGIYIIITDYFADSILAQDSSAVSLDPTKPYEKIIGKNFNNRFRVGAVIGTGYKTRYKELIQSINDGASISDLQQEPICLDFLNELSITLNTAYSTNPDFYDAWVAAYDSSSSFKHFSWMQYPTIKFDGETYDRGSGTTFYCAAESGLKQGEIKICTSTWRKMTKLNKSDSDSEYWNSLKGKDVTIVVHDNSTGKALHSFTFKIVGYVTRDGMRVSVDDLKEMHKYDTVPFALYFDNTSDESALYEAGLPHTFFIPSMQYMAINSVGGAVAVFKDFFVIILVVLYVATALLLVFFGIRCIRNNYFEIGVLRALGVKTHNLAALFVLEMLLVGIIIGLLAVPCMKFAVNLGNKVLVKGFVAYTGNLLANNITVIRFRQVTALVGVLLILALSMAASLVPILALRRIKPRQIINSKE